MLRLLQRRALTLSNALAAAAFGSETARSPQAANNMQAAAPVNAASAGARKFLSRIWVQALVWSKHKPLYIHKAREEIKA
jgi:hypothetical protein